MLSRTKVSISGSGPARRRLEQLRVHGPGTREAVSMSSSIKSFVEPVHGDAENAMRQQAVGSPLSWNGNRVTSKHGWTTNGSVAAGPTPSAAIYNSAARMLEAVRWPEIEYDSSVVWQDALAGEVPEHGPPECLDEWRKLKRGRGQLRTTAQREPRTPTR